MKHKLIHRLLVLACLGFLLLASSPAPAMATPGSVVSQNYSLFMPYIQSTALERSKFWIEIAAIHQLPADQAAEPGAPQSTLKSDAEWKAYLAAAYPTLVQALKESGAGGTRIDLKWSDIEPNAPVDGQPTYYWSWYDDRLRQVGEAGLDIIITVTDPPAWAADGIRKPIYADRLDEFARFLTDLVNRYKAYPYNVKYWELINEPDCRACWGNDADAPKYAAMLSAAYPAIKTADSSATVLHAGLAYDWFIEYEGPFYRYFPDRVMEAGGGAYFDAFNLHYFPAYAPEWERWVADSPERQTGILSAPTCGDFYDGVGLPYEPIGKDVIAKASHYQKRMQTCYGLEKPLWITELAQHGYPDDPAYIILQSRYVIQGNVRGLAAGATNIIWYALTTPNDVFEQQLLYNDWTPKPAFYTFKTLVAQLQGFEYVSTLSIPYVEGYTFYSASTGKTRIVAWGNGKIPFQSLRQLVIVDRLGNVTLIEDGGTGDRDNTVNNRIVYKTTDDPVFLEAIP